jgi:hypothetical protein
MQAEEEKSEEQIAQERRQALRASLERERDGYKTRGLDDRAAQVEEQIKLLGDDEGERPAEPQEPGQAEETSSAPQETAVESKPRRTAGRGKPGA